MSLAAPVDVATVAAFVSPSADALVQRLFLARYRRILSRFVCLERALTRDAPSLADVSGFHQSFVQLGELPAETQCLIFTYPSFGFWLDVAEDLVARGSHVHFPDLHVSRHLEDLERFAATAKLASGANAVSARLRADQRGSVALPGLGLYVWCGADPYARVEVALEKTGGEYRAAVDNVERRVERLPSLRGGIELNALDLDLRLPGRTTFDYPEVMPADVVRWQALMDEAWSWLEAAEPALARELSQYVRAVVPIESQGPDIHASATFREAPGLMALSWTGQVAVIVEAIVHEYHHDKMNALIDVDRLVTGPTAEPIYYSPWRDDPRPLMGILQGAFAFQAVIEFWERFLHLKRPTLELERLQQRLFLVHGQVRTALKTLLDEAALTPVGEALVRAMAANIQRFDPDALPIAPSIRAHLQGMQSAHRARWESAHSVPDGDARQQTTLSPGDERLPEALARLLGLDNNASSHIRLFDDRIIAGIEKSRDEGHFDALTVAVSAATPGSDFALDLVRAHMGYVSGDYHVAAEGYEACLRRLAMSLDLWRYFAFALRHLGRHELAMTILTNLGLLTTAEWPASFAAAPGSSLAVEERVALVRALTERA